MELNFRQHEFDTVDVGLEKLRGAVKLRNEMGGALYWNIVNDDCLEMASRLLDMGVEKDVLEGILQG